MSFVALGVEHTSAPLAVREQAALDRQAIGRVGAELMQCESIAEAAVLSTCNRTEIYLFANDAERAVADARQFINAGDHLRVWSDRDAVEHLFRVASGLESQVLGEAQILAQVREALEIAQSLHMTGPNVHNLFRSAVSCARQARAGTGLGRVEPSVGRLAVQTAEAEPGDLHNRRVLVVGGGEICRVVLRELQASSPAALYIANRTVSVAQELAGQFNAQAASLRDLPLLLPHVDLVITATSAPHYVLAREDLEARDATAVPLYLFDLAVPRDVDPAVASLPAVRMFDLDSLLPVGPDGRWQGDIAAMEAVIAAEVHEFMAWYLTRRVVPIIASLRSHVEAVQRQERQRVASQLQDLTVREQEAVDSLTSRLIDKMFHHLVMRLRMAAQTDPTLVDAAEFFFLHGEGGLFEHAATQEREPSTTPDD